MESCCEEDGGAFVEQFGWCCEDGWYYFHVFGDPVLDFALELLLVWVGGFNPDEEVPGE